MRYQPYRGDNCKYRHKSGETWVPYGSTSVKLTDDYRCAHGYDASVCDCPDDLPQPEDAYSMRPGQQRAVDAGVD